MIQIESNKAGNPDIDEGDKNMPTLVKRELDSPEASNSKRIRTASGTKSGHDLESSPATVIKIIKKEPSVAAESSPTKTFQDGVERSYFARKSDPPTPKKVPERTEEEESEKSSTCLICLKMVICLFFCGPESF